MPAKLKRYLDNNKKLVSKWVIIKRFILFYFILFFGGREGEEGGDMKNENEIKDENENKATYFYVQGAR